MNEIRDLTSAICLHLASDPHLLQGTIRQSIRELCSFSRQMKSLGDYGPMPISKKLFEPVSPGESSPCHSDNCLEDDEEKTRVLEPSLYEVAEIFLDTSAIIEITQPTKSSNWCLWIMINGLNEESAIKGLLTLIDKHLPNVNYETCKKVVYKGQVSFALHFKEHFTTQKVFTFLSEDFYAKAYIKDRWQVLRFYNRMDDPKYMSQFFGVILENLPVDCTSQTIIDLVSMHSSNISALSVEIPTLIGESLCSFIRTKTLEDAETLALTLNGLITQTGNIRAGLHPKCNFKHQNFDKDPFKEIKLESPPKRKVKHESLEEKKNDLKSLLSLFKGELKTPGPKSNEKHLGNVDLVSHTEQGVVRNGSQLFETFSPSNPKVYENSHPNLHSHAHFENEGPRMIHPQPFPQFPPPAFQRPHPGGFMIPNQNPNYLGVNGHSYNNIPPQAQQLKPSPYYGRPFPQIHQQWHLEPPHFTPYDQPGKVPLQRFGKKIQKITLKPTPKPIVKKLQLTKTSTKKQQKLEEIPNGDVIHEEPTNVLASDEKQMKDDKFAVAVAQEKKNEAARRDLIDTIQSKNKQNLEKIFEKKLSDWNIGVYQVKSTFGSKKTQNPPQSQKKFEDDQNVLDKKEKNVLKKNDSESQWSIGVNKFENSLKSTAASKWKITLGTAGSGQRKTMKNSSANITSDLENLMDQMISPLKSTKDINQKRSFENLNSSPENPCPDNEDKTQNNIREFKKNEEKELSMEPYKKIHLDTFVKEIPAAETTKRSSDKNEFSKRSTFKVDSLGWSIKCQPSRSKALPQANKNEEIIKKDNGVINNPSQVPLVNEKIPQAEGLKSNEADNNPKQPAPVAAGPTNIVFNGPYVQSSNLNYMYLHPMHPNMTYPNLLMNMNHHHHPPLQNPFLAFNPQMMVYHNNFILNPLVPPPNQPFWNMPTNPHQKSHAKKFKDFKAQGDEECPEPEATPPVFPKDPQDNNPSKSFSEKI